MLITKYFSVASEEYWALRSFTFAVLIYPGVTGRKWAAWAI